jgi:hypothetical protein
MLKGFFGALLYGCILVGRLHAQEVIVAREAKPEAPKQATPAAEESPSEPAAAARTKPKSRERKRASAEPTLEQMRMAGALAAERLNNRNSPQTTKSRDLDSEATPTASPAVSGTATPAKRETRPEETNISRRPGGRTGKPGTIGAVRTTLMESGRAEPTASPPVKGEARDQQTPAP